MNRKDTRTSDARRARTDTGVLRNHLPDALRAATTIVAAALAMASPLPARSEPITTPEFPGKCLDAGDALRPDQRGASLRLMDCNGSAAQDFKFDPGTSTIALSRPPPALCLDTLDAPSNGAAAWMTVCDGSPAQRWAFPFDGRIRATGVDPNKCLTHTTRPGKSTGWVTDVVVLDPGCEFPEIGGGGFCAPTFGYYSEIALFSCDGRNAQQWRLPQAGIPVPPDGSKTQVLVKSMRIDDCREGGACDWRLDCGIGREADVRLLDKVEKNTGGTIPVDRTLVHEGPLPVTVTCHVREFDAGIFDPDVWEVVGTTTLSFAASGAASMGMDNSEGKVTIDFEITRLGVVQQPSTVEAPSTAAIGIDPLRAMRMAGVDFSVSETELRQWLGNPEFTPYPAVAAALVKLLDGKRLKRPVFLDVIVFNYEHAPGATSPRKAADVDPRRLADAVLAGHNKRYGETARELRSLIE